MIYYNVEENLIGYLEDGVLLLIEEGSVFRVLSDKWELIEVL